MANFKIIDQDRNLPFEQTDYYKWLDKQNLSTIHYVSTKVDYLETFGFIKGKNFISKVDLHTLKSIEEMYARKLHSRLYYNNEFNLN